MRTVFRNSEIPARIAQLQPFLSVGRLPDGTRVWSGYHGGATLLGHLPNRFRASAREAVYVVYSYDTPIAWVSWTEDGTREPYRYHIPDIGYSPTTGQHQAACMEAWADYMRRQGDYRRWPASHRETVQVPGNAEVYGRTVRARSGGIDWVRPGDHVGRVVPQCSDEDDLWSCDEMYYRPTHLGTDRPHP